MGLRYHRCNPLEPAQSAYSMDERSFQRLLRRTVAIPVALLVLLAVVLVVEILSLTSTLRQFDSTLEVISNARSLLRYMVDMESLSLIHI